MSRLVKTPLPLIALLLVVVPRIWAQGGPPMLTDDPGTPGPNKWEINVGWTDQRTPGDTELGAPQLDLNYGIGDRIELTYFNTYVNDRSAADGSRWGLADSELACKWRFYDAGEDGLQASVYPQVNFLTPFTHSDRRGFADKDASFQLPFELEHDFKLINVDVDFGHLFGTGHLADGWFGGLCLGKEVRKGWELVAEIHFNASNELHRAEAIVNAATRIDLSERYTLMLLIGRDLNNHLTPVSSLMSYVGIQIRL